MGQWQACQMKVLHENSRQMEISDEDDASTYTAKVPAYYHFITGYPADYST
jgi:hypothetical protein